MSPHTFALQAVPPANGAAAETQPSAPPTDGGAAPPEPGGLSSMLMFLMFVPLLGFMFWQSRSQQKKQEAAVSALKKGDRVVTQSGLIGRLLDLEARTAKLELAPGVKVQVLRSSLVGRDAEDSAKPAAKEDEKK